MLCYYYRLKIFLRRFCFNDAFGSRNYQVIILVQRNVIGVYSQHEKSRLREAFWTAFGKYMNPLTGAGGTEVNWINYKTGVRYISFRMEVVDSIATVAIVLSHPNLETRSSQWDTLLAMESILKKIAGLEKWEKDHKDHSYGAIQEDYRLYQVLEGVNIYKQEDWPKLITFYKALMIALDAFWEEVKYGFEN